MIAGIEYPKDKKHERANKRAEKEFLLRHVLEDIVIAEQELKAAQEKCEKLYKEKKKLQAALRRLK